MPSKATTVALMMGLFLCRALVGATPGEVFSANRATILSEESCAIGGYYFSRAVEKVDSNDGDEREVAKEAAAFWASTGLVWGAATERLEWPDALAPEHRRTLKHALAALIPVSANVQGLTLVYESFDGECWTAVAAVPEEQLASVPRISFEEARNRLLAPELIYAPDAPVEALAALRALEETLPAPVDRAPWAALLSKAVFATPRLSALSRLAGRYPVGTVESPKDADYAQGLDAYGKGNLQSAYAGALASAEWVYTFDALNMAGNVARRLGKHPEAAALLLHAAYLKPDSPYPWVHLAFVAKAEGNVKLAEQCCEQALERGSEDTWVVEQVAVLRKPPAVQPASASDTAKTEAFSDEFLAKQPSSTERDQAVVEPEPAQPKAVPVVQPQSPSPAVVPKANPAAIIRRVDTPPDVF